MATESLGYQVVQAVMAETGVVLVTTPVLSLQVSGEMEVQVPMQSMEAAVLLVVQAVTVVTPAPVQTVPVVVSAVTVVPVVRPEQQAPEVRPARPELEVQRVDQQGFTPMPEMVAMVVTAGTQLARMWPVESAGQEERAETQPSGSVATEVPAVTEWLTTIAS